MTRARRWTAAGLAAVTATLGAGTVLHAVPAAWRTTTARVDLGATGDPYPSPPPTTSPATTAPASPAPSPTGSTCTVDAKLVPSCNLLWGAAAGGFGSVPRDRALRDWEVLSGRAATIFHAYHRGDELFPTKAEIAMARDAANPRVLMLNWKVANGSTWAGVAAGEQDARIDRWAAHVRANFPETFFLVPHHEPENDVVPAAGSGMTATDYAAMYRHVVTRLRAAGLTNVVTVLAYLGNEKWLGQGWWPDLYPGDSYVDWIGLDSYVSVQPGAYHYGAFADLLDRKGAGTGNLGFYAWATSRHPDKPIIVAEWGAYHPVATVLDKALVYGGVAAELRKRPAIKGIVYFDTKADGAGDRDISIDSSATALAAFRRLAADPMFTVTLK
ncbi:glycoside hydrolase family 26 protein [Rhizomonospora bruguierae]|uniref:glycoside hydrolase family 26 protein n=1 Tax=Rhizomonospora bruguierae TaxID=1581705 RepID=UPI0020C0A209|nr:glycosyl hydrolase [Micromonospora sp. NBRC 107566]